MRFVVTAGPTREHLDPVRFLSNPSTGKMGFAVAAAAARCGSVVTLVAGPVALKTPRGVRRIDVVSAREMLAATVQVVRESLDAGEETAVIATAAVADWRPARCASRKLKKSQMTGNLRLVRNTDILKTLSRIRSHRTSLHLVGFAAETDHVLAEAARKCQEKGLDFIVANDVTERGCGFGSDTNRVAFVHPDGTVQRLPLLTKRQVASRILAHLKAKGKI